MALTVQDIYTSFARLKKDVSDVPTATFVEWVDWINKDLYRNLKSVDPERFITTATYTISSSPSSQALPADFRDINEFGCGFFEKDSNGNPTENALSLTGYGSNAKGYYITAGNVVFTGINNSLVVVLRYIPILAQLTALGDDTIIPDDTEYLEFAVKATDVMYSQWDEEAGAESLADARYVRALNNLLDKANQRPKIYGLTDYTINY